MCTPAGRAVPLPLALALLLCAPPAAPQLVADSTFTVEGFLQQDHQSGGWTIVVPLPVEALGVRTFVLALVGRTDRWSRLRNRYVEARGRVSRSPGGVAPGMQIDVDHMRDVDPPGTAQKTIDHGVGLRLRITVSVIPNRFAWRDAHERATGVNPLVLYTILSQQAGPVLVEKPANDLLCVRVTHVGDGAVWDSTLQVHRRSASTFIVEPGGVFRDAMQLPEAAAPRQGRYLARVGICETADYDVTAQFEVH